MEFLTENAIVVVVVAIVSVLIGRYIWPSKEDMKKVEKDMNKISAKVTNGLNFTSQECKGALHNLQLTIKDDFAACYDKNESCTKRNYGRC